jgi:hypothetical protein
MMQYVLYDMACQAFIVALLTHLKVINPHPAQQAFAGSIFLILAIVFAVTSERKRKEDS